ncbi:hypothetical protein MAR_033213 [Mya arenaria]|uniref:Uncharacterized protein n=1 Tax=Mya arenaria TaxID=6604 RepID=A0ABY7GHP3_MYAAR|nr:hypothetical protein MAR_033213 [Mya arenaria]
MRSPEFIEEFDRKRRERMRNRPFMEYVAKHDIELPRAPAFRGVDPAEVDHIVKRLTMKPSKRFPHFQFNKRDPGYNDWRSAHDEKIRRLRETVHMFGEEEALGRTTSMGNGGGKKRTRERKRRHHRKGEKLPKTDIHE